MMSNQIEKVTQDTANKYKLLSPIVEHLPHEFPGGSLLDNIVCRCKSCKEKINMNNIRGNVTIPIQNVLECDMLASCDNCRHISDYRLRFRETESDVRVERIINGEWTYKVYSNQNIVVQFLNWINSLFK